MNEPNVTTLDDAILLNHLDLARLDYGSAMRSREPSREGELRVSDKAWVRARDAVEVQLSALRLALAEAEDMTTCLNKTVARRSEMYAMRCAERDDALAALATAERERGAARKVYDAARAILSDCVATGRASTFCRDGLREACNQFVAPALPHTEGDDGK